MNTDALKVLLENIRYGKIDVEAGISRLQNLSYIDLGHAKLDTVASRLPGGRLLPR
jgi:hypothetical protein